MRKLRLRRLRSAPACRDVATLLAIAHSRALHLIHAAHGIASDVLIELAMCALRSLEAAPIGPPTLASALASGEEPLLQVLVTTTFLPWPVITDECAMCNLCTLVKQSSASTQRLHKHVLRGTT
jgi:hypothetical protein